MGTNYGYIWSTLFTANEIPTAHSQILTTASAADSAAATADSAMKNVHTNIVLTYREQSEHNQVGKHEEQPIFQRTKGKRVPFFLQ